MSTYSRAILVLASLACLGCPPESQVPLPPTQPPPAPTQTPPDEAREINDPPDVLDVTLAQKIGFPGGVSARTLPAMKPDALKPKPYGATKSEGLPPGRKLWSVLRVGEPANVIPFVIVGQGKQAKVYVDVNQNDDVTDDTPFANYSNDPSAFASRVDLSVRYADSTQPMKIWLYTSLKRGLFDFYTQCYWQGELRIDGKHVPIYTFERFCDGNYADHPVGVDVNGDGNLEKAELVNAGESILLGKTAIRLRSVSADGSRAIFEPSTPGVPTRNVAEEVDAVLRAVPFSFTDIDGTPVAIGEETLGKVVLIDFWATWCGPCMAEMPHVKALAKRLADRDDFLLVGVSLDSDRKRFEEIVAKDGLTWPQHCDGKGSEGEVVKAYDVTGIPATFVINRKGVIVAKGLRGENLSKTIDELLGSSD
jgi:thiol-disulfide isomerase/thioredoxin